LASSLLRGPATLKGGAAVTIHQITLRDRKTQTVIGYRNGAWTTDRPLAMALRKREAEADAASLRDRCQGNAELLNLAAADLPLAPRRSRFLPSLDTSAPIRRSTHRGPQMGERTH
jgi:hypothetical protein